jgi:hypothetical protein
MVTSWSSPSPESTSYSMLISVDPSPTGDGQEMTAMSIGLGTNLKWGASLNPLLLAISIGGHTFAG